VSNPVLSIIAPCYNEEKNIPILYDEIKKVMETIGETWELILINDGSRDRTLEVMMETHDEDSRVKLVNFARNFGHQTAVTAGMDFASGDAVVLIDADLQDPPEVIIEMMKKWHEGYHVVYGVREKRLGESKFKLWTAKAFYRLIYRITDVQIPLDTGDFRLMDRRVVEAVNAMREHNRFVRGLTSWVGFRQTGVTYVRPPRQHGETNYPLRKMLRLAMDAITGFS
jgi:dolichol-phosphate mannosyltransferase